MHLVWKNVKVKGEVVFLQQSESLDPGRVSEVVVMRGLTVLRLVWMEVEHVTDATETA